MGYRFSSRILAGFERTPFFTDALKSKVDSVVDATTSVVGMSALATSAEINTGTNTTKSVTPSALNGSNLRVKTIKKSIGYVGSTGHDFAFVTAANMTEQVITLTNVIPAFARVIDVVVVTRAMFGGAVSLTVDVGSTSGGAEFIAASDLIALNAISAIATGASFKTLPVAAASSIYINATPGANWSLNTAGTLNVYISYIDVTGL